jgi:hypothetical protein
MPYFKQKCYRCKVNYVTVSGRSQYPEACMECQKKDMQGEVTDPELKKLLDIPEEFYMTNNFLRSIKINAVRYGKLSERQIEAFKQAVEKLTTLKASGAEKVDVKAPEEKPKKKVKKK